MNSDRVIFELTYDHRFHKPEDTQYPMSGYAVSRLNWFASELNYRVDQMSDRQRDTFWGSDYNVTIHWKNGLKTQYISPVDFFVAIKWIADWTGEDLEDGRQCYSVGGSGETDDNWFKPSDNEAAFEVFEQVIAELYPDDWASWQNGFAEEYAEIQARRKEQYDS